MKNGDAPVEVVREWIVKAEEDIAATALLLAGGGKCPVTPVCLHAQQAVEKYLKALLVARGTAFPKTHDIRRIIALMPPADRPVLAEADQDMLTDYATVMRYPGGYDPITLAEARRAAALARRVRSQIRKRLPKGALRAGKR